MAENLILFQIVSLHSGLLHCRLYHDNIMTNLSVPIVGEDGIIEAVWCLGD